MRGDRSLVRSEQWWHHKIPPLIAAAALTIGAAPAPPPSHDLVTLVLFLVAAAGIAAFGHLVNDLADRSADRTAGKPNRVGEMGLGSGVAWAAGCLMVGLLPWVVLPRSMGVVVTLALEVLLLFAYSVPPLRLKGRGIVGALADAAYAYVVPLSLTVFVFSALPGAAPLRWWVLAVVAAWSAVVGLRGILWHQIEDRQADRTAAVSTFVRRLGAERSEQLVAVVLTPLEAAASIVTVVVVAIAGRASWLAPFAAVFLCWRLFQVSMMWAEPLLPAALSDRRVRVRLVGFALVNEFVERWLPLASLVALAVRSSAWWLAVVMCTVLFRNALLDLVVHDLWAVPDGLERLALSRRTRRDIALVAQRRAAAVLGGPAPRPPGAVQGRWVFVVCGATLHLDSLVTAVRHLRPVTASEIWLVTDQARNERSLSNVPGIDHVVTVRTPVHLDDHQASIWLKTSVYRHLPPGEWCYLDSDVIAVDPGVDSIFDHRKDSVAFASDLTIATNDVDRFSPWAMTCACSGMDDLHSCDHLRQQLAERLDLDVPGGWVHWNGGVFLFGNDSHSVLDAWHRFAVESFEWPEWRTRDQGALIATAWSLGIEGLPRLPQEFNFIADLGNEDLCLDVERGWALHPSGPWCHARFLHLYTSALDDPEWDLGRDVEAVVLRRSTLRMYRWRRGEIFRLRVQNRLLRLSRQPRRLRPSRVVAGARRRWSGDWGD